MATKLSGRVISLQADRQGVYIGLDNDPKLGPKGNIWQLKQDHSNYNALFSLFLAAAANRWPIGIRIEGDDEIDIGRDAAIRHAGVSWNAGGGA